jgi:trimeric autotransporter adhesin
MKRLEETEMMRNFWKGKCGQYRHLSLLSITMMFVAMALVPTPGNAQTAAGTTIGNQASATYTDASSVTRTATSNIVTTVVQQVASLQLTANGAKTSSPGSSVFYPHTLINTGNGSDSFTLSLAPAQSGAYTLTGTHIYLDANGDGVPDNFTDLTGTSVTIAAGAANAFKFVITGTVPAGATAGQTNNFSVTATSVFDNTKSSSNTDITTVTSNAVLNLNKVMSSNTGASPSGPYTVTLTYTNSGNSTATTINIGDALPAGMTYVAGTGRWSVTGATALTDATGDVQPAAGTPHIDYSVTGNTITAIVDSVAPGTSGQLTFGVNIAAGLAPGVITNTATIAYNDGSGTTVNGTSNAYNFTVRQSVAVTISDTGVAANDNDATINGIDTINAATQGATVTFTDVVTNAGNGTDSFDITVPSNTFPAGTVFTLYKSDGVTPLIDTNGNSTPDSGPLAAGASYTVIVKAALPSGALGGPFNATITATSTAVGAINAGANASMTDRLVAITANSVDLTNNAALGQAGVLGTGPGPEVAVVVNNATNPGTTTTFTLFVNNSSAAGAADSYDLLASSTTTFGTSSTLPAGWTVTFRASLGTDCTVANLGTVISNTGVVNGGTGKLVCAVISIPANYAAGAQAVYFQSKSPVSGALDSIHDQVTVNTVHNVTLTPNGSNQVFPGGSVVYSHNLTNNGNVSEAITFVAPITADSQAGWSSVMFQDTNSNGTLDAADLGVSTATTFTLTPGQSVVVFVKVSAPSGAAVGTVDTTTARAAYNATFATALDQTTVIAGELRLLKEQALDASCAGVGPFAYTQANITAGAVPKSCVVYRITATNAGTSNVTGVVVSDATPSFTLYSTTPAASTTVGTITAPANGAAGSISATVGTLTPGQSAVIIFAVKIQ